MVHVKKARQGTVGTVGPSVDPPKESIITSFCLSNDLSKSLIMIILTEYNMRVRALATLTDLISVNFATPVKIR